jgi:hypothetical protein
MDHDIKVGDEAQLKSGGPIMTVEAVWPTRWVLLAPTSRTALPPR